MSNRTLRGRYSHQNFNLNNGYSVNSNRSRANPPLYSQVPHVPQNAQVLQNCTIQGNSNRFCDKDFSLDMNANQYSVNQALVGVNGIENMNPRLLIPPIIAARSHDLDSWRANNLVVHSHINEETNTDTYQSGYDISECCDYLPPNTFLTSNRNMLSAINENNEKMQNGITNAEAIDCDVRENYSNVDRSNYGGDSNYKQLGWGYRVTSGDAAQTKSASYLHGKQTQENFCSPNGDHNINFAKESYGCCGRINTMPKVRQMENPNYSSPSGSNPDELRENYTYNCGSNCNTNTNNVSQDYYVNLNPINTYSYPYACKAGYHETPSCPTDGDVNTQCGYNPEQLFTSNLPTNYLSGECSRDPNFSEYNKNLFTNTLQPGVYVNQEILDPISSNMGISFTQQFAPTTKDTKETLINTINNGVEIDTDIEYTLHDPRLIDVDNNIRISNDITESNVYDPRQYGYGTSYRGYLNKDLGNVKYYYDDVDAIRRPNYITRSKIDFLPYANTYGPRRSKEEEDYIHKNIRALANNSFLENSINMRTDLQEKLMRKSNAMIAQRRLMPLSRASHR